MRPTRWHRGSSFRHPIWPCSGWGLPCGTLLPECPVVSYTAFSPLQRTCGLFLWHFPWGHPRLDFPGTLLPGVRTFLGAHFIARRDRFLYSGLFQFFGKIKDFTAYFTSYQFFAFTFLQFFQCFKR